MSANCSGRLSAKKGQIITMIIMAMKTMMVMAMKTMMVMALAIMMLMIGCKVQMAVICGERSDAAAGFLRS